MDEDAVRETQRKFDSISNEDKERLVPKENFLLLF